MNRAKVLTNSYFAGRVTRYHTWPMHHNQTVGEHTFQVMRIWWHIWGPLSPEISTFILFHDAGELKTGDIPYPMKVRNPEIKKLFDAQEAQAVHDMGGRPSFVDGLYELSQLDRTRVKICDSIDLWETGLVELQMGNKFATPIVEDGCMIIYDLAHTLDVELAQPVYDYLRRVKELLDVRD